MPLSPTRAGIAMGVVAYAIWGLLPIFLKLLRPLGVVDILAYRILWSLLLLLAIAIAWKRGGQFMAVVRRPRLIATLCLSAALIGANWLIYIHAVNSGHVLDASLGYFINPLVNVLLGMVVLRERLGRTELAAIALAAVGVATLAIWQQALPLVSLALALTFAFYGLVRKMAPVDSLEGLLVETLLLMPLALGWLLLHGSLLPPPGSPPLWLIASSGLVTATPLLLFAAAAKRIRYADLGLLQYLAPTLQLACAIFYGEPLLPIHMVAFAFIWGGLLIYAIATWRRSRVTPMAPE
jgi:chloramphenicol-sensitive protein RarD